MQLKSIATSLLVSRYIIGGLIKKIRFFLKFNKVRRKKEEREKFARHVGADIGTAPSTSILGSLNNN